MNISDEEFLLKLYLSTRRTVYGICLNKTRNTHDAENCTSEVFLLAIEKIDILKGHPNPKGWLYKSTYNIAKEFCRKKEIIKYIISLDENNRIELKDESFENELVNDSYYNELVNCIYSRLSTKDGELFRCIFIMNLGNIELAEKYGISVANLYVRKNRLVKKIKKVINKC